jgi:anti-sigma factor ChrR (cupin superfamily)
MPDEPQPVVLHNLFGPDADLDQFNWQPFKEGIEIYRIYGDGQAGAAAALLRYQPGASVPLHVHPDYELVLILRQGQADAHGIYPAGTLLVSQPGSQHEIRSPAGCVVLIIWNKPVVFI